MFPCSYAYIDFGSSQRINRLTARYNPSVVQVPPSRYEIPEKQTGNYEPLAADVYMLGKLLLEQVRDSETLVGFSLVNGLRSTIILSADQCPGISPLIGVHVTPESH